MKAPACLQVAAYAKKHRHLQQEYDAASARLQQVERLLKDCQCSSSEELLQEITEAQADLDRWYQLEGGLRCVCLTALLSVCLCLSVYLFGLSVRIYLSFCLSVHMSVSVCLSVTDLNRFNCSAVLL